MAVIQQFWSQVAAIQRDAVAWMCDTFTAMMPKSEPHHFIECLYKLLMMAPAERYYQTDNWPSEQVRLYMPLSSVLLPIPAL